jgi:hypothetical protein
MQYVHVLACGSVVIATSEARTALGVLCRFYLYLIIVVCMYYGTFAYLYSFIVVCMCVHVLD